MGDAARHAVTAAQANRFTAARQHLLRGHGAAGVLEACRAIVALHSTEPTAPYLSLHARVPGFARADLDRDVFERRSLLRIACMRTTVHLVPSDEVGIFQQSCACVRQSEERRILDNAARQIGDGALANLRAKILARLGDAGPATAQELAAAIPGLRARIAYANDKPYAGTYAVASPLLSALCTNGLLVRGRPRGTWRSSQYEYALLSAWAPDARPGVPEPREARRELARRYLRAFGPATPADLAWWTGLPVSDVRLALADLGEQAVAVEPAWQGGPGIMLREDVDALLAPSADGAPSAWLLPPLDPYIMGYRDRGRFLAPEHTPQVIDRAGNAMATVWAGGRVAGVWGQRPDGSVAYRLFAEVSGAEREALDSRAAALGAFLGGEVVPPRTWTPFSRSLWQEITRG